MGKGKKRGRPTPALPSAEASEGEDEWGGFEVGEIATTIRVLTKLASSPSLLASKLFKPLRTALDPLVRAQLKKYDPVDYVARVTSALQQANPHHALLALQGMRDHGQQAKQGTIQRWVRDCDTISNEGGMRVRLLQAVLQASRVAQAHPTQPAQEENPPCADHLVAQLKESVDVGAETPLASKDEGDTEEGAVLAQRSEGASRAVELGDVSPAIIEHTPWVAAVACEEEGLETGEASISTPHLTLRVVMKEEAAARHPPNHYDLNIYACKHGQLSLSSSQAASSRVRRVDCPHVPGAFMLCSPRLTHAATPHFTPRHEHTPLIWLRVDVLSPAECDLIVGAAQQMGFTPDHPLSRPRPSGIGACEWLVDDHILQPIFERCRSHLPASAGGGELAGINPHWRMFHYSDAEGAVYRPHIDGSWPGSGLDANGRYCHDLHGDRRSRYTFLVYLTGGFEGGHTTFYTPDANVDSGLHACRIQPIRGSVFCFPQGNTASLLHEGSAVLRGEKIVIRTDVLYLLRRRN